MPARRHNAILVQRLKRNDFHLKHRIGNVDKTKSDQSSGFCCFGKSSEESIQKKKKTPTTVLAQRRRQQLFCDDSRGEEPILRTSPTHDETILEESSSDLSSVGTTEEIPTRVKRVRFASEVEIKRISLRANHKNNKNKEPTVTTKSPTKQGRSKRNLKQSIVNRSEFDKKKKAQEINDKAKSSNKAKKSPQQ